ncbi:MAG TPA: hypothetical protein DHM42_09915 [Clostridiales bacterium]|jgi:hypothetical protein|nr:hypothetical protein [Clostridiales bacterium]
MKGIEQLQALLNEIEDTIIEVKEAYEDDGKLTTGEVIGIVVNTVRGVLMDVDTSELPAELADLDKNEIKALIIRVVEIVFDNV